MNDLRPAVIRRGNPPAHYTQSQNVANQLTEIYRVWVPRGEFWWLDPSSPFLCYLAFGEDVTPGGTGSQALACTYNPARVLNSAGGYTDGKFQDVRLKADNTQRTITAVNDHIDSKTTKTITISDATAAAHRVLYVPWASGRLIVRVEEPKGLGVNAYPIYERDTKQLHAMNQYRFNSISCPFPILQDFSIVFYLDAAWQVVWDTGASSGATDLPFAIIDLPVKIGRMSDLGPTARKDVARVMATMSR